MSSHARVASQAAEKVRASAIAAISSLAIISAASAGNGASSTTQVPDAYSMTVIQGPSCGLPFGSPVTAVRGMNAHGHVVGYYADCEISSKDHGFVWYGPGRMITLTPPPGIFSLRPADINDDGVIVGQWEPSSGPPRGFVYDHGTWIELLPPLPQGTSDARAINNSGAVTGIRSISIGTSPSTAYYWTAKDGIVDLGVINITSESRDITEGGTIAGSYGGTQAPNQQAVIWVNGKPGFLPQPSGSNYHRAVTALDGGAVLGISGYPTGQSILRPTIWSNSAISILEPLPGHTSCTAADFDGDRLVVGRSLIPGQSGSFTACRWHNGVPERLLDLVVDASSGLSLQTTQSLNAAGQILVDGSLSGDAFGVLLTPIPTMAADLNDDAVVNGIDLGILLAVWGSPAAFSQADFNADGMVNGIDLGVLLAQWTLSAHE